MYYHLNCLLYRYISCLMVIGVALFYYANPSFAEDVFTQGEIEQSLSALSTASPENNCDPDYSNLPLWDYAPQFKFEKRIMQGMTVLCPKDITAGSTDTAWNRTNSGTTNNYTNQIVLNYARCPGVLAEDPNSSSGYSCTLLPFQSITNSRYAIGVNECQTIETSFKVCTYKIAGKICAYVPIGSKQMRIGCIGSSTASTADEPSALACFMPRLCYDDSAWKATKNDFSVTGTIVQCVSMAVRALLFADRPANAPDGSQFFDTSFQSTTLSGQTYINTCSNTTMFENIQTTMRRTVFIALSLYIMLWGFQYIMAASGSGRLTTRGEFIKRIVTISLVLYFAVGPGWDTYFPILLDIMQTYSKKMLDATTLAIASTDLSNTISTGYCQFNANQYNVGFETYALWDTIDCKIHAYFFGDEDFPKIIKLGFALLIYRPDIGLFILFFTAALAFFLFGILFQAVVIFMTSLIGLAIVLFLSPIFIPMVLFTATKGYFSGWLRELISMTINPIVLFAFMGISFTMIDTFMIGDPTLTQFNSTNTISFVRDGDNLPICDEDAFACQLARADIYWDEDANDAAGWLTVDNVDFDKMAQSLCKVLVVLYLLYQIMGALVGMIMEITGSLRTTPSASHKAHEMMGKGGKAMVGAAGKTAQTGLGAGVKGVKAIHAKRKGTG